MTSFAIQNFGCRVNQAEAFFWAEEFERTGLRLEDDVTRADWVVVNTCTLTARADRDVRKFIRRISRLNPQARLIIVGCAVDGGQVDLDDIPPTGILLTNAEKKNLAAQLRFQAEGKPSAAPRPLRSRALLKIQDGCDCRCTFCIIPRVRGRSTSSAKEEILARARALIARGFREIVLCGIHLSSYGQDLLPRSSLLDLLSDLTQLDGLGKIRMSSLDPRYLDDELIEFVAGNPHICPHFHLSLQHGSDRILKLMDRGSRVSQYTEVLARLRQRAPAAALGADIIVGFPGETDEDFERTAGFLRDSPLDYFHVFAYSSRPDTPAAAWPQVPVPLIRRRSAQLRTLSEEKRRVFREMFVGRVLDGIIIKRRGRAAVVLTSNYIEVQVPACLGRAGEETKIRLTQVEARKTWGEPQ
jgi:threonylcarbamoyladenosine tRNA methylthiotransferase MtaB